MGSVRTATGDTGALEDRYEYDAFGQPYAGNLDGMMNLGYTGKPYDTATGMYNYGYRDYRPQAARFTTVDPIRDGNNWYAYVNNDPVNYVDLWGLEGSKDREDREILWEFDRFMDFIKQQGVERVDASEPYRYEKIVDSWDNLPESIRNYVNNEHFPWSTIVTDWGNHDGEQKRLPGGYHIAEAEDEKGNKGVYVHHDTIDPTTSISEAKRHDKYEVKGATDPGPRSTDDRHPDWCNGK
jgi:RHS repeat-associated protein